MIKYIFILLLFTLVACMEVQEQEAEKSPHLNLDLVDYIKVAKQQSSEGPVRLSASEKKEFVSNWNNAIPVGMCKYIPEYNITVYLTNDSTRKYWTNRGSIKESNDLCYDFNGNEYFDLLWENKQVKGY